VLRCSRERGFLAEERDARGDVTGMLERARESSVAPGQHESGHDEGRNPNALAGHPKPNPTRGGSDTLAHRIRRSITNRTAPVYAST
jgi:hypothetical protein